MKERLKKLYKLYNRKEKFKFLYLFFLMIIASILEVAGVGIIPAFIVSVTDPDKILNMHVIGDLMKHNDIVTPQDILFWGSIALIAVFLVKNVFLFFYSYTKSQIIRRQQIDLSVRLFKAYMFAPYSFLLKRNSAELLRNVNVEVKLIIQNVTLNILKMIMDLLVTISILIFLIVLEPLVTITTFIVLGGVSALFLRLIRKKVSFYGKSAQKERRNSIIAINQGFGGIKDTSVLHKQSYFIKKYRKCITIAANALKFREISGGAVKPLLETITVSSMLLVGLILIVQERPVETIVPLLALFGAASLRILPSIRELVNSYTGLKFSAYSIDPVYNDIVQLEKHETIDTKNVYPIYLRNRIELRNLSFKYTENSKTVLNKINLTIEKGSAVAFVGPTGAGKSTLIDLILGLLKPTEGKILIDGTDINTNITGWQKNLGYVPQSIYLSDNTIKSNIAWGLEEHEIDHTALKEVINAAQLEELIQELPKGLDTFIGERGIRLSGGQRQRIGIARALYNNPEVLVLDEATSSLDNRTEKYVIEAIERLKGKRTIIMIAHRLTTVMNCDVLYLLKNGNVVDCGTYNKLLSSSKEFQTFTG